MTQNGWSAFIDMAKCQGKSMYCSLPKILGKTFTKLVGYTNWAVNQTKKKYTDWAEWSHYPVNSIVSEGDTKHF